MLFNTAKPFWISESKATPGSLIYVFGFGMRPKYASVTVGITGKGGTFFPPAISAARGLRTKDSRLMYIEVRPVRRLRAQLLRRGLGLAEGGRPGGRGGFSRS